MGIVDRIRSTFSGPRQKAFFGFSRAYEGGRRDIREFGSWNPQISHPDEEVNGSRDAVVSRTRDLIRNHPVIAGGLDRRVEAVVGPNLRLEAQPNYEAMGRTPEWADAWSTNVESKWSGFANDPRNLCDVERQAMFGGVVETAYRHYQGDGEVCAIVKMLNRGGKYQTCVQLIDPDRLSNPHLISDATIMPNGNRVYGGVEIDEHGAATAYWVRTRHPNDRDVTQGQRWTRVERELGNGRPNFIHAFKRNRAEQRRGVSRLASALKQIRMSDRYDNAELEAAILNAVMAISVESPYPTDQVMAAMAPIDNGNGNGGINWAEQQVAYREKNKVAIPGVMVRHMLPGEETKVLAAEHPNGDYPAFQAAMLRKIAGAMGVSYEQLSQDWSNINYSSARTLLNEIWRGLLHDRFAFTQAFCTPIYTAWLEEAALLGEVKIPGGWVNFYKWRSEICQVEWKGPGRGSIDPKKESDADETNLRLNSTTLADIASDQGRDPRKIAITRAREIKFLTELGLVDVTQTQLQNQVGRPPKGNPNPDNQQSGASQ